MSESTNKRFGYFNRRSLGDIIIDNINGLLLLVFCITIIYPFWTHVLLSFSSSREATSLGFRLWIKEWTLESFKFAFKGYGNIGVAYANSVYRAFVGTILTVFSTILLAYPLSHKRLPGRTFFTIVILITMFFSGGIIPEYLLIRKLGLINTRWSLILPTITMGFYVIIMRNFLMTLDPAYEEASSSEFGGATRSF